MYIKPPLEERQGTFSSRRLSITGLKASFRSGREAAIAAGPSKHWLKIKNTVESELILLGLERDTEGRPFAHVARENSRGLDYAGMAFRAFSERLYDVLSDHARTMTLRACAITGLRRQRATWLRPEIRVRVRHLRNSTGLRHASVLAIV
jgi:ATP-dependent DNA ligase